MKPEFVFRGQVCCYDWRWQLRSLWTAYCILADYEVDTLPYDNNIARVWDAVIENRNLAGSSDIFDDFDCFDEYMCEHLV